MANLTSNKLSDSAFYALCAIYLFLVFLVLNFQEAYFSMDKEDGIVELSGALALLVTSIILVKAGLIRKKTQGKMDKNFWMLLGAGVLFFWAAGEEISWGQHMLGTQTPEWLSKINGQNETNLHNINKKFFDRWLERFTFLLAALTAVTHFRGKDSFLGFRLPEYPLAMAFLMLPIYRKMHSIWEQDVWPIGLVIFLGYPILGIVKKDKKMLFMSALFVITVGVVWYFHSQNWQAIWGSEGNILHEWRETLFAFLCVVFGIQLLNDEKKA